ncbi:tyrosine phosphatase: receptor type: K-like protein [Leptotrombidium deliense]|uniref:protein-tyrosine-phosphatase n=1 Tax=Leptotrombidium deliense TaxID=299467 RepID=A0A443SSY6_9ACAR|nr:tyrosine phosphatase: receptor type: K-like protein [Leptotrombidium deliense]
MVFIKQLQVLRCVLLVIFSLRSAVQGVTDEEVQIAISSTKSNIISEKYFSDEPEVGKVTGNTVQLKFLKLHFSAYYIIVELRAKLGNHSLNDIGKVDLTINYTEAVRQKTAYYAAIRIVPEKLKETYEFVVGNGKSSGLYTNPPLKTGAEYRFGIAAEFPFYWLKQFATGLTLITPTAYEKEEDDISRERKSFNDLSTFEMKSHPIAISELSDYVNNMNENCGFKQQFMSVSRGQWAKWDDARLPENKGKNRYGNLLAYDFNRVQLTVEKNEENIADEMEIPIDDDYAPTDYINASLIDGYKCRNRYIATQGPLQSTIKDFWKMVWQCDSRHIVMLTNVEELGKMKCDKYWPENISIFGLIKVKLVKTNSFADYIIRKFIVEKKGHPEREVIQYHFVSWPDHTVPTYSTSLISFVKRIRENSYYKNNNHPIIAHCSAGVGRTGTLIAIDAMLEMASQEKYIDVLSYLCTARSQRINMIEKLQQYIFVHQILVEMLCKDNTDIVCSEIDSYINRLKYYDPNTKKTLLESQFETLNKLYSNSSKELCAAALANPTRNRNQEIVPSNSGRVVFGAPEDYINAVYVNGYKEKDAYIVTEIPVIDTRNMLHHTTL